MGPTPPPLPSSGGHRSGDIAWYSSVLVVLTTAVLAYARQSSDLPKEVELTALFSAIVTAVIGFCFACVALFSKNSRRSRSALALVLNLGGIVLLSMWSYSTTEPIVRGFVQEVTKGIKAGRRSANRSESDGVKEASRPIPQNPDALTWKTVVPHYQAWIDETMLAAYEAKGKRDPKWDDDARQFIRGEALRWFGADDAPSPAQLASLRDRILAAGCDDPLILFLAAQTYPRLQNRQELLQRAVAELPGQGYAPGIIFFAQVERFQRESEERRAHEKSLGNDSLDSLRAALSARPMTVGDGWFWNHMLCRDAYEVFFKAKGEQVCAVLDSLENVPSWFKHRMRGLHAKNLAWAARSSGWSSEVTREGWAGFQKHLTTARAELTKAWELNPQHPAAAAEMIGVAMGVSDDPAEEMRLWFDRAVQARFDYMSAYSAFRWGLRERWHGSPEAMLALGEQCLATKRFDTWVPAQLLQSVKDIASEWDERDAYYEERAPWDDLQAMFEGYIAETSQTPQQRYYRSEYAVVAAKCGETDTCYAQLQALEFQLDPGVANSWELNDQWVSRTAATSGPASEEVETAEENVAIGDLDEALKHYEAALKVENLDAVGRAYITKQIEFTRAEAKLQAIEWRPFLPAADLNGWQASPLSNWALSSPDILEGTAHDIGKVMSSTPVGSVFEMRGEIEIAPGPQTRVDAGIIFGQLTDGQEWGSVRIFQAAKGSSGVMLTQGFQRTGLIKRPKLKARNTFELRSSGGEVSLKINGQQVLDREPAPAGWGSGGDQALLGFAVSRAESQSVRFHNIQIRVP